MIRKFEINKVFYLFGKYLENSFTPAMQSNNKGKKSPITRKEKNKMERPSQRSSLLIDVGSMKLKSYP